MTDYRAETNPEVAPQRRSTDHSRWAKVEVWFARRALIVFAFSLVTMAAGFLGYTPGKGPGARLNLMDKKIDSTADTLSKKIEANTAVAAARLTEIEKDHHELRNYVRFLVVKSCLEATPETRRDLEVANISCRPFLINQP